MRTGGSTAIAGISGIGIFAYYGVNIIDNTIAGVMPGPAGSFVAGISATGNGGATLSGNRISGLQLPGAGSTWGIVDDSARSLIVDNMIFGPDTVTGTGIACITPTTIAAKNYIIGFEQPVQGCQESGNIVNPD